MKQTSRAMKDTGSLVNYLMGNNQSVPVVGKGATICLWTDREAYEVMEVTNGGKRVVMQKYIPERTDNNGMSDSQSYKYEKLEDEKEVFVYRYGSWRRVLTHVRMTKSYSKEFENALASSGDTRQEVYDAYVDCLVDKNGLPILVEGKTELYTEYQKVNILFGVKAEYFDYSF